MLVPPEHRKHTNIAAKEGRRGSPAPGSRPLRQPGGAGSPRERSALLPGRARPCCGFEPGLPRASNQPPPGVFPSAAPLLSLTFLGSDHEPPGMIRNTWPLGAAGAQEIRTLELEKNQGSRLENKHRFRGWGCLCGDVSPASSGRAGCAFPAYCRHPVSRGHSGFIREGAGGAGEEGGREKRPSSWLGKPQGKRLIRLCMHCPAWAACGLTFSCLGL